MIARDRLILKFLLLALDEPGAATLEETIDRTTQYGKRYNVTHDEVERLLDKPLRMLVESSETSSLLK